MDNQIYRLGWVYGTIAAHAPEVEGDIQLAAMRPWSAMAQVISKIHILHKCTEELDRKIAEALNGVDDIDITGAEPVQPLEAQGAWQLGYYAAKSGKSLSGEYDLAGARKRAGLTQKELAEKLGVSQPFLSAVEKGAKKAPDDMIQTMKEILNLKEV